MLDKISIEKIQKQIKRFAKIPTFDIHDLWYYDHKVNEKVEDKNLYEKVLTMNLSKIDTEYFYSGEDIIIYESKDKKHYIYRTYTWGD